MPNIIIIEKDGTTTEKNIKSSFDLVNVFKVIGLRKPDNFEKQHTWKTKDGSYLSLYAKTKGKANYENKCELPPPIDSKLYFGNMVVLLTKTKDYSSEHIIDLSVSSFEKYYEELFGGFEDITSSTDETEEDELANVDKKLLTKQGYLKDDFIVDDEEDEDNDGENDEEGNYDDDEDNDDEEESYENETYDSELDEEEYISESDSE
jgi:hypothetical protein